MGTGPAHRLHHRHPSERIGADIEDEGIPVSGDDLVRERVDAAPPEIGTGIGGRLANRRNRFGVGDELLKADPPRKPFIGTHVGVLDVHRPELGVAPRKAVSFAIALEESEFGYPIELVGEFHWVALEAGQYLLPTAQDLVGGLAARSVGSVPIDVLLGEIEKLPLHLKSGDRRAISQRQALSEGEVVAHVTHRGDG